ncbi:hypothetical protein FGO68_gene7390 [Halteria grandinella]|uniref:Uncharacterized protein n=1 Tax=Halteria grandinella TaxID=5974 RepID=A0A8J8P4G7_HALGN|nr:hypothetical protein FGO68_gene7390 [Halteria grandinella]
MMSRLSDAKFDLQSVLKLGRRSYKCLNYTYYHVSLLRCFYHCTLYESRSCIPHSRLCCAYNSMRGYLYRKLHTHRYRHITFESSFELLYQGQFSIQGWVQNFEKGLKVLLNQFLLFSCLNISVTFGILQYLKGIFYAIHPFLNPYARYIKYPTF